MFFIHYKLIFQACHCRRSLGNINYNLRQRLYSIKNDIRGNRTMNWKLWCLALNKIWKIHAVIDSLVRRKKEKERNERMHKTILLKPWMDQRERQLQRQDSEKLKEKSHLGNFRKGPRSCARFFSSLSTSCFEWYLTIWTDKSNVWCDVAVMETNVHWNT